jgi:DNA-binding MarR family transcriptional regulator
MSLRLDDQLCFRLYATSRAVQARYRPHLDALGITYPQYLVLLVLWEHGTVPMKDLARRLRLDSGTLTPLLKRMEGAGLVARSRDGNDARVVVVAPTAAATAMQDRAAAVPAALCAGADASALDLAGLATALDHLLTTLESP